MLCYFCYYRSGKGVLSLTALLIFIFLGLWLWTGGEYIYCLPAAWLLVLFLLVMALDTVWWEGFSCDDGRIWDIAADLSGQGWVGQQWDGSNFHPFELVLKVISKGIKGEQEHDFVGRKSQRQCWTKLPFFHFHPQTLF